MRICLVTHTHTSTHTHTHTHTQQAREVEEAEAEEETQKEFKDWLTLFEFQVRGLMCVNVCLSVRVPVCMCWWHADTEC